MPLWYAYNNVLEDVHYMFASEIKGLQKINIPKIDKNGKNTISLLHKNMVMVLNWKKTKYEVSYVARGESVRYHEMEKKIEGFYINSNYTDYDTKKYNTFFHDWKDEYLDILADEAAKKTYELLDNAVRKRLLSDVPIATINSGGIDSTVITYLASQYIDNITSYTINFDEDSEDLKMARLLSERNNINLVEVKVPQDDLLIKERFLECIETIEYPLTVQVEVGILCSFMAKQISDDGFKVVFSGEGSDEAYGSYGMLRMFSKKPDWSDIRKALFNKQFYGNLLRGNNIFMKYGTIEMRTPFFDTEFLNYTTNLSNDYTSSGSMWKYPLVNAFKDKLPDEILYQPKRAFQKGTNFKGYIEDIILKDTKIN